MTAAEPVFVALLRGVNVGGNRKLPMASLRELLSACGARDVRTYIQSGNAVFRLPADQADGLPGRLSDAVHAAHGFAVSSVLRSAADLERLVDGFAFPEVDERLRHVAFLRRALAPDALAGLPVRRDRYALRGAEIHLAALEGLGETDLPLAGFERLDPALTVRNWRTVCALRAMATT